MIRPTIECVRQYRTGDQVLAGLTVNFRARLVDSVIGALNQRLVIPIAEEDPNAGIVINVAD
ncbi:MAG: hypothetical protein WCH04_20805 [Gammaproteobacteria bacterium]